MVPLFVIDLRWNTPRQGDYYSFRDALVNMKEIRAGENFWVFNTGMLQYNALGLTFGLNTA